MPSQAASFSVNGDIGTVLSSDIGVLVVPEGASAVHVHSRQVNEPIFWSLGSAIHGDRVSKSSAVPSDFLNICFRITIIDTFQSTGKHFSKIYYGLHCSQPV